MADIKKIATRVSYGNTLVELAQQGADNLVVFDADLAAATKTDIFKKARTATLTAALPSRTWSALPPA